MVPITQPSRLYIVRIWSDAEHAHGSVRDVEQETTQRFERGDELLRLLSVPRPPMAAFEPRAESEDRP